MRRLLAAVLVALAVVVGMSALAAGSATLPGCSDTYPDNCGSTPTTPVDTGSQYQDRTVVVKDDTLPFTGGDVGLLVGIGVLVLVLGSMFLYSSRHSK